MLDVLDMTLHWLCTIEDWFAHTSCHRIDWDLNIDIRRSFECSVKDLLLELCLITYHWEIVFWLPWFLVAICPHWLSQLLFVAITILFYSLWWSIIVVLNTVYISFSLGLLFMMDLLCNIIFGVWALAAFKALQQSIVVIVVFGFISMMFMCSMRMCIDVQRSFNGRVTLYPSVRWLTLSYILCIRKILGVLNVWLVADDRIKVGLLR